MAITDRAGTPAIPEQLVGFAAFFTLALVNIFHHTPWRDELQAFLIARESPNLIAMFHAIAYEGHPGLWHLILFPVVRLVDTPFALKLVQAPITCVILALLWLRSPFTLAEKFLLSAGYFFLLEYTVIARGYGLGVALFFAFIVLRETRWAWLVIGVMANTDLQFSALGGVCALLLIHRGNRPLSLMALCFAMALFGLFTAWPAPDATTALSQPPAWALLPISLMRLSGALFPAGWGGDELAYCVPGALLWVARLLIGVVTIYLGARSLRKFPPLRLAFLGIAAGLLAIGVAAYTGYDRHYGVLWVALIGLHWIAREESCYESKIFRGWAMLAVVSSAVTAIPSLYGLPFTGGYQAAEWLKQNTTSDTVIAAYPGWMEIEATPYLDRPVFNLQSQRWETFTKWDYKADKWPYPEQLAQLIRTAPKGPMLVITDPRGGAGGDSPALDMLLGLGEQGFTVTYREQFKGNAFDVAIYQIDRKRKD